MAELGILLEARAVHTSRSARNHLLALAQTNGVPRRRVNELIDMVGLQDVAGQRVGGFSLGMGQRLGIASALLGDPRVVVLDEPVNGLDPEGVLWVRNLLKGLAADGHTVFVSSHLMSEMALMGVRGPVGQAGASQGLRCSIVLTPEQDKSPCMCSGLAWLAAAVVAVTGQILVMLAPA